MRGRRDGSRLRFQRLWNSFQAIWKAMKVLPVPVASVSRMRWPVRRRSPPARARRRCPGSSGWDASRPCPRTARRRSGRARRSASAKVRSQSSSGVGIARHLAFRAGLHVDAVDALAVGGVGEADGQLAGIVLRLRHAFGQRLVPRLGLDHGQLVVAIDQHVVGGQRLAAPPVAFDAAQRDRILAADAAALDHAPARRLQRGIDVLGSGLGFVHGYATRNAPSFFRQPSGPVLRQAADAINPSLLAEIRPAPSIFHLEPCCRDRGAAAEVVPAAAARPISS